ncbi:MAG TPA: hypothetical protein VJ875_15115 [Pyrinomonadaceae bacterium]|nr:hypothetical protein [Pyrinomonadaceae bacterium]
MSEMRSVSGILEVIKSITSNHESGRLEIVSSSTRGTLLFNEGKLVDARLGSLSGFQAVNTAVALRDVQVSFDHVTPASHLSSITQSERVVLKRFFGIDAAEMDEPAGMAEPEIDWNPAPEPVVPLNEAATIPLAFFSVPRLAACLVLLIGLAVGAIALRSRFRAPQPSAPVATVVESQPSPVTEPQLEVKQVAAEPEKRAAKVQDITGEWHIINTVQKTAYKSFDNMKVGFRLKINQQGKEFTGKGEKFSENGQTLPAANRTPIHVTGSIDGDKVVATFVEDGRMRKTNGRFVWKLQNDGDQLAGTFVSTAANSSGRSAVIKQQ